MVFSVWLDWRNGADLNQLLADQQNPTSPAYRHWLRRTTSGRASPPPQDDLRRTSPPGCATRASRCSARPDNRLSVTAAGTVNQVESAFQVNEGLYQLGDGLVRGADAEPLIPTALAANVRAITGLDGAMSLARPRAGHARAAAADRPVGRALLALLGREAELPLSRTRSSPGRPLPWIVCGYTPSADHARPTASTGCTAAASTAAARRS